MIQPKKKQQGLHTPDTDEMNTMSLQAEAAHQRNLQNHQEAFLEWLENLSRQRIEIDRYNYRKIR